MTALHTAVACCGDQDETVVDQWLPLGPTGGCIGGEWTAWIDITLDCPEEA